MDWHFGKNNGREGFTATAMTYFAGGRLVQTVRETIQNSLDATNGLDGPVKMAFSLDEIALSDIPSLQKLGSFLQLALDEETKNAAAHTPSKGKSGESSESEAVNFYKSALRELKNADIRIFGVHDWGTTGLKGAVQEHPDTVPGPWLALIRGKGVDVKNSSDALGSFGQGGNAPFTLTRLRTLFYLSQTTHEAKETKRFIGKTILSSMWLTDPETGDRALSAATGFFAADEEINPFTGNGVPDWASQLRSRYTESNGTSIFILLPYDSDNKESFELAVTRAVILNFYFSILIGNLEVTLPSGEVLTQENVKDLTLQSGILEDATPEIQGELDTLRTLVFAEDRGFRESETFGEYFFAIRVGDELPSRKIGVARKTGMLITKNPPKLLRFSGVRNFDLFVCVTGHEGSQVLRDLENPSHDTFEFDRVSNEKKRKSHEKKYTAFERELRELINSHAALDISSEMAIQDFEEFFGGNQEGIEDKNSWEEFPDKIKIARPMKRPKTRTVFVGVDAEGSSGGGGQGNGKGSGSSGGAGDLDGTGLGSRGGSQKSVEDLLFAGRAEDGAITIFFSWSKSTDKSVLHLYRSGEVGIESIRMSVEKNGSLQSGIPKNDWVKVGNGSRRFKCTFYPQGNVGAVEGKVSDVL
jgi:hypothetical protein